MSDATKIVVSKLDRGLQTALFSCIGFTVSLAVVLIYDLRITDAFA